MGSLLGMLMPQAAASSSRPPVPGGSGMVSVPGASPGSSPDLTLIQSYLRNGTVHANVAMIASSVAAQKWGLYRQAPASARFTTADQGSDQRTQVMTHAFLNVLENPASIVAPSGRRWPVWDRFGLFEISQIWLETTGKSYWVVDNAERSSPMPLGLWPVRPDRMVPVPDKDRYLAGWLYRSPDGREVIPFYPDEVIFNRYPDPEDAYGGAGPVRSVIDDIQAAGFAAQWNKNYFVNSAEPGGVIEVPEELSDEDFNRFTNRWRETHRGVARAHRVAVLEAGAKWVANSHSARDMDFVNLRTMSRDIIREALAMGKTMTGVSDDVNRANAQTAQEVYATWTVAPRLERWRNVLNHQLLPLFGATAVGLEADFTYPNPVNREADALELSAKSTAALNLVTAGYDQHDVLATVGFPDMKIGLTLSDTPALPPRWTAPMGAPPAMAASQAALRDAAGWGSPLWAQVRPGVPAVSLRDRPAAPVAALSPVLAKKDAAAKVFEQEAKDYPPHAMTWMHQAQWKGPAMIPLAHIAPQMQWMDGADPDHVQDFVKRLKAGKKVKPLVLVATPDSPKLFLVDGHHRYLAYCELDMAARGFIGSVASDHGPWEQMHSYQMDHGGKEQGALAPANAREMAVWNSLAGASR